ncbi:heme oxygenase 1, chloroplastic-like [Salvia hispanica]|uniref:heme oxygenase 1, chloroplastic-like n=1 Tax=Salvia hispanica TaxID=49212 RepID=UPI00200937FA|nr:heme oxygenase 1, chloroplastic-like [Salvia hispanica]
MVVVSAGAKSGKKFADEMKMAAMKLHKNKPGEKEPAGLGIATWEPTLEGYLSFLANTKLIYEALENIVDRAVFPHYAELRKTGLERSERIAKDMEWFEEQGYAIPQASSVGINYAQYLCELSENEPHAFLCHFYMIYFGHTAGGRMIGKKVEEKILNGKELECYKYEGELPQLLQNVRDKLNTLGERWSREEKNRCLDEFQNSFKFGGDILRLVLH